MNCNLKLTTEGIIFDNVNLKYVATKTDKYDNEIVYYAILNDNFEDMIKEVSTEMKTPYFSGKDNYILKIKSKYLKESQKISGHATVKMKAYSFEEFNGYFVNELKILCS